jgi:hypothetical protein
MLNYQRVDVIFGRDPLRKSVFSALLEIEIVFERS